MASVAIVSSAGGDRSRWTFLTDPSAWADKPRWSPSGQLLYYILRERALFNVWAQRFDTASGRAIGPPVRITNFNTPGRQISPNLGRVEPCASSSRLILPIMEVTGAGERRLGEFLQQRVRLAIDHAIALLNRSAPDRLGQVALARARRAQKEPVVGVLHHWFGMDVSVLR